MKKTSRIQMCLGVAVTAALALASSAVGAGFIHPDSTTWEGSYEANVLPDAAGWSDISGGIADSTVMPDGGNNYLNTLSTGDYHGYRWVENPGTLDPQTNSGMALEFRIQVHLGNFFMHMWPSSVDDARWLAIYVSDTNITVKDADAGVSGIGNNNDNDWTTWRIVCDDVSWKLYRDADASVQVEIPVVSDSGPYGLYQFAVYGVGTNHEFDLDYMRWTDGVPEPATLGLLTAGGLLLGLRRRKR